MDVFTFNLPHLHALTRMLYARRQEELDEATLFALDLGGGLHAGGEVAAVARRSIQASRRDGHLSREKK